MERKINYTYYMDDPEKPTKIIALSTFAGKSVRGIAKCSPNDTFNEEIGKKLAQLRCDARVASKRAVRAKEKVAQARAEVEAATKFLADMEDYYCRSLDEYNTVMNELVKFTKSLD